MDVSEWLRSLGLGQYDTTFRDNGIDADVLFELTEADFEKLGVLLGHRRRLTKAIATVKSAAAEPAQGQPAAEPVPKPHAAERRQLTVVFCDLAGSTAMSALLDCEVTAIGRDVVENGPAAQSTTETSLIAASIRAGWPRSNARALRPSGSATLLTLSRLRPARIGRAPLSLAAFAISLPV